MNSFTCIFVLCAFSVAMLQCALAEKYTVGGTDIGWTPQNGAATYSDWAYDKKFHVGDTLVFEFDTGGSDVQQVLKHSYDECNLDNVIAETMKDGPASVTLDSPGDYYYICTFSGRGSAGQKLAISVENPGAENPPENPGNGKTKTPGKGRPKSGRRGNGHTKQAGKGKIFRGNFPFGKWFLHSKHALSLL